MNFTLPDRFEKVKVKCPRDGWSEKLMPITLVHTEGHYFPLPSNGCDAADGHDICQRCAADVLHKLFMEYKESVERGKGKP